MEATDSYNRWAIRPKLGTFWIWEPEKPWAREAVRVSAVFWNGEEWFVKTTANSGEYWNDLSRFWEAVLPPAPPSTTEIDTEN